MLKPTCKVAYGFQFTRYEKCSIKTYLMCPPLYTMSQKNVPRLACYNCDTRERILIFCGRNTTDKVRNQKALYYATSNNLCFCTTWQNG